MDIQSNKYRSRTIARCNNSQLLKISCIVLFVKLKCNVVSLVRCLSVCETALGKRRGSVTVGCYSAAGVEPPLSGRWNPTNDLLSTGESSRSSMTPGTLLAIASFSVGIWSTVTFTSFNLEKLHVNTDSLPLQLRFPPVDWNSTPAAMSSSLKLTDLVDFDQKTLLGEPTPALRLR